jgi:hypothetical protein
MASFRLTVDAKGLETLGDAAFKLPAGNANPLMQWNLAYSYASMQAPRPTVAQSGEFRGNPWAALAPQYVRADGTVIPVWGGVRKVSGKGNVKPKKRPSGAPYSPQSLQMQDTGRMFQDFFLGDPEVSANNTVLSKSSAVKYAPVQDARRPFVFGPKIEEEEGDRLEAAYLAYLDGVLK